jgi:hypothetical protein
MMDEISEVLAEKAKSYDTGAGQAWEMSGRVLAWMHANGWLDKILLSGYGFAWVIILVKLIRLLQDPSHEDSWLDISGYGKLALDRVRQKGVVGSEPQTAL